MSQIILLTIVTLVAIGAAAAIILYFVAQRFKVYEDPRIDRVEDVLPAANCPSYTAFFCGSVSTR